MPGAPRCLQFLTPGSGCGVEGWLTPASAPDWSCWASHDDTPRLCVLSPGRLRPCPITPSSQLTFHPTRSLFMPGSDPPQSKPAERLSSAVIKGFPPDSGDHPVWEPSFPRRGRQGGPWTVPRASLSLCWLHTRVHPVSLSHTPPAEALGDSASALPCLWEPEAEGNCRPEMWLQSSICPHLWGGGPGGSLAEVTPRTGLTLSTRILVPTRLGDGVPVPASVGAAGVPSGRF